MPIINFRLREYPEGWIVEVKLLFGWKHVTHYRGLPDSPFYYKTPGSAKRGALEQLDMDISDSYDNNYEGSTPSF